MLVLDVGVVVLGLWEGGWVVVWGGWDVWVGSGGGREWSGWLGVSGCVGRVSGWCGLGWSVLVVRLGVGLDVCGTVRVRVKLGLGLNSG